MNKLYTHRRSNLSSQMAPKAARTPPLLLVLPRSPSSTIRHHKPQAIQRRKEPIGKYRDRCVYDQRLGGGGGMWSTPAVVPVLPRESLRGAPTAAQPVSVLRANSSTALENSPDTRVRTVSSNSGGSRVRKSNPSRAMT